MKRFITIIMVLFILLLNLNTAYAISPNEFSSEAQILMDADTGQILYGNNIDLKYAPASTTKILTALIALDKCQLTDKVIVGKKPPYAEGSKIYLIEGEELTVEQLIYALLLESANDAAEALAEHISGSVEEFALLMNEYAKNIGCKNSNFVNPHGLYSDNHYTTAYDLALISKQAMKNEIFRKIISTRSYKIEPTNKQPQIRYLNNHNKLLWTGGKYYYRYATGMKTGYTIKSRHTFVGSATKDGINLIAIALKSDSVIYPDIVKLFEYGFNNFKQEQMLNQDKVVTYLKLNNGEIDIPVYPKENYHYLKLNNDNNLPKINIILENNFENITKNQVVGNVEIILDENVIKTVDLIAGSDYVSKTKIIEKTNDNQYITKLKISYKYILISFLSLFTIRGFYRKYKRKYKK